MAETEKNPETPLPVSTRLDAVDWRTFRVTTALTLLGYVFTLAPEVTLDWAGILTTGAMYGGVGPPAGYPAWTIYSWFFIHLFPFSNPAWRVAVGSAVAGAVSCGLIALMVSRCVKILFADNSRFSRLALRDQNWIRVLSGYVAGLALGFSGAFWGEAVVPDFVTFTTLLLTAILWLLMRWLETGRRRLCCWAFLLLGLLLTNAQEMITALPGIACAILLFDRKFGRDLSLILLPVAVLVTSITQYGIWEPMDRLMDWPLLAAFIVPILIAITFIAMTRRFGSEWKSALACTGCFLLGFALYLYLPIISATKPPVNWAYSRNLEGFIHLIARGQYDRIQPTNNFTTFAAEVWRLVKQTIREFGWPYVVFAFLPFCCLPRMAISGRKWICALSLISLCVGPLLVALLDIPDDRQMQELSEMYFLPLRVPLALFTGIGLMLFATRMALFVAERPRKLASHEVAGNLGKPSTS